MKYCLKTITPIILFLFLPFAPTAFASFGQFGISGEIAAANLHLGNSNLGVTSTETDRLHETSNPTTPEFSLGINYTFPFISSLHSNNIDWFPAIKTALNVRYLQQKITGNVYQYQDPAMNNYDYRLHLYSIRLMLDAMLTLFTVQNTTSVYLLGGVGNAWNELDYQDSIDATGVQGGALKLNNHNTNGFTSEIGGGVLYSLKKQIDVFLEYRYEHSQSLHTGATGVINGMPVSVSPASFPFSSQTIALGLNWNI